MHICYISQEYPPETGWGGIGSYTYEMAHGLVAREHKVTVISAALEEEKIQNDQGVIVHRIKPAPDLNKIKGGWRLNKVWPGFAWAASLKLKEIHLSNKVDLVEAGECRADSLFVPYLTGIKVIIRLHLAQIFVDKLNHVSPNKIQRLKYWLEKRAILDASAISAPNQTVVDLTKTWISVKGAHIIANPINTMRFSPTQSQSAEQNIIYIGRLERRKGIHLFPEIIPLILEKFPNVRFQFIGSGGVDFDGIPWEQKIRSGLSSNQQERVVFNLVARSNLRHIYSTATVCVLPSIWENFPYALLEAMACGSPVVATRTGGLPELIEENVTGLLVPPEDPLALSQAILELLRNRGLAKSMGSAARSRIERHFSRAVVLPQMLKLYRQVLEN